MKVACCNPLDTPGPPGPGSIICVCVCECECVCVLAGSGILETSTNCIFAKKNTRLK